MTCMHSSLITYFLTNLHIHKLLSTRVCTDTHNIYYTFKHLPHLSYSTKPDSVYSLNFRVRKQRKIIIYHTYCYHAGQRMWYCYYC
jgi:hypothetical protein